MIRRPPRSTLFPYPTLSRSRMRHISAVTLAIATLTGLPGQGAAQRALKDHRFWAVPRVSEHRATVWTMPATPSTNPIRSSMRLTVLNTARPALPRLSWTQTDLALASAFTMALLVDAGQTRWLAKGGWHEFRETHPILGPRPNDGSMLSSFTSVNRAIVACTRCPRLRAYCERVARDKKREFSDWEYWGKPVPGLGDPQARLLVVGLAPAAHGANRTGRMFTGDSSGTWLYEALYRHGFASQPQSLSRDDGLTLNDCYIAAAARCAPPGNKPSRLELERCRPYLAAELRLLRRVRVVVTLGRIAHESWLKAAGWWQRLAPRDRPPFGHGVASHPPDGSVVIASYHPSRQNTNTGKLSRTMWYAVFRRARAALEHRA